jgi:hypothetical protein
MFLEESAHLEENVLILQEETLSLYFHPLEKQPIMNHWHSSDLADQGASNAMSTNNKPSDASPVMEARPTAQRESKSLLSGS